MLWNQAVLAPHVLVTGDLAKLFFDYNFLNASQISVNECIIPKQVVW